MITRTITISHRVDGVLTDLDSIPVLRDSTSTYGVKRNDDNSIVVAQNTPFVKDAMQLGTYSYDVQNLVAGISYTAAVERVFGGETKRNLVTWTARAVVAAGLYANEDDLDDLRGIDNITNWSDLSNNNIRDSARIQRAFDSSDAMIEKELERVYSFPLASLSDTDAEMLRGWSSVITAYFLYRNRGLNQMTASGRPAANPFKEEYQGVLDDIWLYANNKRTLGNNKRSGSSTRVILGGATQPSAILRETTKYHFT